MNNTKAQNQMTAMERLNDRLDQSIDKLRHSDNNLAGLFALWVILFIGFASFMPGTFLQVTTFEAMMYQIPELGLLSLAMAIPLISGGLNLAIIATTNQAALLMGWILTAHMPAAATGSELALWISLALLAGLLLCLLIGFITGFFVAVIGVHPILVTLGTMTLINGLSIFLTRGRTISGFPEPLLAVSNSTVAGIPISFSIFLFLALIVHLYLTRTPGGIRIHMLGSNMQATRYSGIDHKKVLIGVYTLSSLLCWVAAIITMARFNSSGADFGQSYLLITILAAILGGIDPYGGFGRISGLVIALIILQTISSGFNLMGLSTQLSLTLWGVTLIMVMVVKRVWADYSSRARSL